MSDLMQSTKQRIVALDAMRGFALCGIIFANLVSFTGFYSLSLTEIQALPWWDRSVLFTIDFLVEGKFYTVFATLFGAGFAIQYARFQQSGQAIVPFWLRRMSVLCLIGLCHMYFIWHGDILTLYSLLGLCLPLFMRFSSRSLLILIGGFLSAPIIIHVLLVFTAELAFWQVLTEVVLNLRQHLDYENTSLLALRTAQEAKDVFWGNVFSAIPRPMSYLKTGRPFQVLGQFLLGVFLARLYFQGRVACLKPSHIIQLLIVGVSFNVAYAYIKFITGNPFSTDALGLIQGVVYHLGCLFMALGYMALLYRLWQNGMCFYRLAQLGRMALTMYLMQTSLCVLLFYGYGFAWMGNVPFYSILLIAFSILTLQFLFASFWLKKYQMGPIEYVWRRFGYAH